MIKNYLPNKSTHICLSENTHSHTHLQSDWGVVQSQFSLSGTQPDISGCQRIVVWTSSALICLWLLPEAEVKSWILMQSETAVGQRSDLDSLRAALLQPHTTNHCPIQEEVELSSHHRPPGFEYNLLFESLISLNAREFFLYFF